MKDIQAKRDIVLTNLDSCLKKFGFKKKAFTFKRETEPGLFQLLELSLGLPRSNESGKIRMEFGIFSDEWHKYLMNSKLPSNLRTPHCEIRDMNCKAIRIGYDWHDLKGSLDKISSILISEIEKTLMPYLDQMKTRKDILLKYDEIGDALGLPPRHKLSIAILHLGMGNRSAALEQATQEFNAHKNNSFYERVYSSIIDEVNKTPHNKMYKS